MSRIEDVANALKNAERIFRQIMDSDECDMFAPEEIYSPGKPENQRLTDVEYSNVLGAGDNLEYMKFLLKKRNMAGKIQLIYGDPPFFSNGRYQASVRLETAKLGRSPLIKTGAYDDRWDDSLEQYLTMLAVRFHLMRELLADTGCMWVHLDWHGAHYVKILLDEIFGYDNFVNEVIWTYKSGGASKRSFARKHDTLLFYGKTQKFMFNPLKEKSYNRGFKPYRFKGVKEYEDENGWYTMVNMKDVWTIDMVGRTSRERTGYATQKPEKLVERIIAACSREGDLCADFFAGSGTLGAAAEKNGRRWIMCDEGDVAIASQIKRLIKLEREDGSRCGAFAVERPERGSDEYMNSLVKCSDDMSCLRIKDYLPDSLKLGDADEDIALEYLRSDSRSCVDFWSLDSDYDGQHHRASEIAGGTDFCTITGGNMHVIGYDVFGNRFCWEKTV